MPAKRARAGGSYRPKATRLLNQVREVFRYDHYSYKTEQAYVGWIVRFIRFNATRHPAEMGKPVTLNKSLTRVLRCTIDRGEPVPV